ncbi:hypothetical protein DNTS_022954 [Danionella cerebrum]|uniref:Glypican-1 n=1 Tax=Danionella cerebrum TaxID=2873325 RepID=A0A553Q2U8_9TELE|nr:hypothetical protein DNTS_022954 [Danionella translucida]
MLYIRLTLVSLCVSGEHLRVCPQGYTCCTSSMEENLQNVSRREIESQLKESGRMLQTSLNGHFKSFNELAIWRFKTGLSQFTSRSPGLVYKHMESHAYRGVFVPSDGAAEFMSLSAALKSSFVTRKLPEFTLAPNPEQVKAELQVLSVTFAFERSHPVHSPSSTRHLHDFIIVEYFLELLNRSEASLHTSFQSGFPPLYSQTAKVFQDLFSELRHYYKGSNLNLEEALNEFWARLLEKLFKALNPQYSIGEDYLECVVKHSETLKPFGETPRELKTKITRTVIAARTFVQGLVISGDSVRKVSQVPLSPECVRAFMKLSYCPHCTGVTSPKPCTNYCKNVMKGCLANQADLDSEWRNLADAMLEVIDKLTRPYSVDSVVLSLPKRITEAILYMQDNLNAFNNKLSDVSRMLRDMMQYWVHLPRKLCMDRESEPSEADRCWNGMSVARYLPEVMGDGLASQINNPEVEIDITKPDMTVRKQILQLKIMINRLKFAANGNDVDFQDTSDDLSGSGSGMCPDDQCSRGPRLMAPKTDRPKVYASPPENKKVVNGRGSQNLPSIGLCLLSLVTILLRR